jgi:hypothetical protein
MNMTKFFKVALMSVPATLLLAACAENQPTGVPSSAAIVSYGTDYLTSFSTEPGTVWVVERAHENRLVYTGTISRNSQIAVDPDAGVITMNGKTISQGLSPGVKREIFFMSSAPSEVSYGD